MLDRHAERRERLHHRRRLLVPHEAVVDVQADEARGADRLVQQRGAHRRVDAAGDEAEDLLGGPDGGADLVDRHLLAAAVRVQPGQLAHAVEEVAQHRHAVDRQVNLRVELDAVQALLGGLDAGDDLARARDHLEPVWHLVDRVAMRQQHLRRAAKPFEQRAPTAERDGELPVLTLSLALDGAAEGGIEQLHAVAYTEQRLAQLENLRIVRGRVRRVDGLRAARDDNRRILSQFRCRRVEGQQVALDGQLTHTPVDHLAIPARAQGFTLGIIVIIRRGDGDRTLYARARGRAAGASVHSLSASIEDDDLLTVQRRRRHALPLRVVRGRCHHRRRETEGARPRRADGRQCRGSYAARSKWRRFI